MPSHCRGFCCIINDGFDHSVLRLQHSGKCTAQARPKFFVAVWSNNNIAIPTRACPLPFIFRTLPQPPSNFLTLCPLTPVPRALKGYQRQRWPHEAAKPTNCPRRVPKPETGPKGAVKNQIWFQEAATFPKCKMGLPPNMHCSTLKFIDFSSPSKVTTCHKNTKNIENH